MYTINIMIHYDIQNIIIEYLYDLIDKLNIYHLTRTHENNIIIDDLMVIPYKYIHKINQDILLQNKYKNIKKLDINNNKLVYDINHLENLVVLDCHGDCNLRNDGLNKLKNIQILCLAQNGIIEDINNLEKLRKLDCSSRVVKLNGKYISCALKQSGIMNIKNLQVLDATNNKNIYDINHMTELKELNCSGYYSNINQKGIQSLSNLQVLNIDNNRYIYDIRHMNKLIKLNCSGVYSRIKQNSIQQLNRLELLIATDNKYIKNIGHLHNLIYLDCSHYSKISSLDIVKLQKKHKLKKIRADYDNKTNNLPYKSRYRDISFRKHFCFR